MPEDEKLLKGSCKECGNHLAFAPPMLNRVITCPHCGQWTELSADLEAGLGGQKVRKFPVMAVAGVALFIAAAAIGFVFLKHKKVVSETKQVQVAVAPANPVPEPTPPPPVATETVAETGVQRTKSHDDLKVGVIELQKTPGTSLVHAVGVVKNDSDFVRYGVKIELALFNRDGKKIGTAQDYQATIEPHQDWRFKALVTDSKAVAAKLVALTEDE